LLDGFENGGRALDGFGFEPFALEQKTQRFQDVGLIVSD
jgi:hypothetical protein